MTPLLEPKKNGALNRLFGAVVNLAMPDSENALADERSFVTGLGMSYFHIPVVWAASEIQDLERFIGVMRALEGDRVGVHFAMNLRVSTFMYH